MKWYRDYILKVKEEPDHNPGYNSPRKSQTFAHSWKPIIVPHDEGCKTHFSPTHLTGPSLGFFKEDFVNSFDLLSHIEHSTRLTVDTQ